MIKKINKKNMVKMILVKCNQEVRRKSKLIQMEEKFMILKKLIRIIHLCSDLQSRKKIKKIEQ